MKVNVSTSGTEPSRPGSREERRVETRSTTIDCRETSDGLELKIPMPGVSDPQDLSVTLRGRTLKVVYERSEESRQPAPGGGERVERMSETRTKEVDLPADVDPGNVDAVYQDGVLQVKLAKRAGVKVKAG